MTDRSALNIQKLPLVFNIENRSDWEVHLSNTIKNFPAEQWNSCINPDNLFLTTDYLLALEQSGLPGLEFYHALLLIHGKAEAAFHFQMVNLSDTGLGGILNLEEYGGLAAGISGKINDLLFSPGKGRSSYLLVCGSLLVSGGYGISSVTPEGMVSAAGILSYVKKHIIASIPSSDRMVAFMVKDFYQNENRLVSPLLTSEYIRLNTDPEMIMEIQNQWKNFDDYLDTLSSKYRVRTNNVLSKLQNISVRSLTYEEVRKYQGELHRLNDLVIRKAPVKLVRPNGTYFTELKENLGDQCIISCFFLEDKMVAFTTGVCNEYHFEAHYIGIDYHYNKEFALYQNILYQYIRDAIGRNSKKLYFGRTALEIKSTVGAKPFELNCYFRFANRVLNTLAKPLIGKTGPAQWTPRDPFKNQTAIN